MPLSVSEELPNNYLVGASLPSNYLVGTRRSARPQDTLGDGRFAVYVSRVACAPYARDRWAT